MTRHIVSLEGPDSAGHYGYTCTCGEDASGYEPEDVLTAANAHGILAGGQRPILARIKADRSA
jgi:hypothetical protein